jgi:hypothetical protein
MIIRRIGPMSIARLSGMLYGVMGLVLGGIISLIALAGGFASGSEGAAQFGGFIGVGAVLLLPICYGLLGFVATLIAAWLYNVAAGVVGGVEVDMS